jgi:gliding motility-associated-like protein
MKLKIYTLFLFLFSILSATAQNQANIWHFGGHAGLDFNTGEPVVMSNVSFWSLNACASISDSAGNLLFSCNGQLIWNRNGQVMQNGDGLIGHASASQGALILQKPGSGHLYYVFTVAYYRHPIGMYYSVVDMTLDGGLGAVTSEKNIPLYAAWDAVEKLTSVRHANVNDIWVITRKFTEDAFASFLLTSSGVVAQPVLSPTIDRQFMTMIGSMKVSHDKKHLVVAYQEEDAVYYMDQAFEVCNFNALTGEIELLFTISKNDVFGHKGFEPWAVEFSPDSKLLYLSFFNDEDISDTYELFQYDMQYIEDSLQFIQSEIKIATGPLNGLQLARDGKIYCTGDDYGGYDHVSIIHEPWKRGLDCNFEADAIYIGEDMVRPFLPNILTDHLFRFEWEGNCSGPDNAIAFQPNFIPEPAEILWSFGDFAFSTELWPEHIYEQGGEYEVFVHVTYPSGRVEKTSRIIEVIESPHPNLGPDTLTCEGTQVTLNAGNEEGMYAWSTGAFGQNMNTITVSDTGIYWVIVINSEGCSTTDSIHVGWFEKAIFNEDNLIITPTSCGGSSGSITGLQVEGTDPLSFEWYDGNGNLLGTELELTNLPVGNYYLHVHDGNGCTTISQSYNITDAGDIEITAVGFSNSHCNQNNGTIEITAESGATDYFFYSVDNGNNWQEDNNTFEGLIPGEYFIRVKDLNGCESVYENNPVIIQNIAGPQVNTISMVPETDYQADGQIDIYGTVPQGSIFYSIDGGTNFQTDNGLFTGLSAGTYNCVVKDEFGCDTTFTIELERIISNIIEAIAGNGNTCIGNAAVSPLQLNNFNDVLSYHVKLTYNKDILECDGYINIHPELEDGFQASVVPALGEVLISWQGQNPLSLPNNSRMVELVFSAEEEGFSNIDWVTEQGESRFFNEYGDEISVDYQLGTIRVYTRPNIIMGATKEVCEGETVMISPFITGGSGGLTYEWTGPDNYTNNSDLLWINNINTEQAGNYTITVTDTIDCVESKSINIIVNTGPTIAFEAYDTLFVEPGFILEAGSGAAAWLWNTGDTTESINIETEGQYLVEVWSVKGCKSMDSVQILWGSDPSFYLPNAFTPNGDGLNDVFGAIPRYDYVKQYHLSIYNRWGEMLFETTDINHGWDGIYKGKACPSGVYVYRVIYEEFGNQPSQTRIKNGTVVLVR